MKTWFLLATSVTLLGCTGVVESGGPDDGASGGAEPTAPVDGPTVGGTPPEQILDSPACQTPSPGDAPLRRLSNAEYRNTVIDLLGHEDLVETLAASFVSETESLGFRNNAAFLSVSTLVAQQYMDAAERIAEAVAADGSVLPCEPEAGDEAECARQLITDFGKRAYRRPLTSEEIASYEGLYEQAATEFDFTTGVEWIVYTMLQSPHFLYRVELGAPAADQAITRPTSYEMASRLSYLLWQSAPDESLLDAAEAGELDTAAAVEAQARRMLDDAKASRVLEYFEQWLDTDALAGMDRDRTVFPDLPSDLAALYRSETRAFVDALLRDPSGSFTDLLTAPYTYANDTLAEHYGLEGASGSAFERVEAPGRAGVLTQGMLWAHDKATRTSIVNRGKKIRLDLFCHIVPAPPNDVELDLEGIGEGLTQRERLELHRAEPTCNACHAQLDPLGVAFEAFDAVGRARTVDETGAAVETESVITGTADADGPVSGATELAAKLAQSDEVRACYTKQSFRFFFGRDVAEADACSEAQLLKAFRDSDYNLRELLVALTKTDAFLYRPVINP